MDSYPLLRQVPIFAELTDHTLKLISKRVTKQNQSAGSTIFQVGDQGDAFFIIEKGQVEILVPSSQGDPPVAVGTLQQGDCFGEISLITSEARNATVRAVSQTSLIRIERDDFLHLVSDAKTFKRVMDLICSHLRRSNCMLEASRRVQVALGHYLQDREIGNDQLTGNTTASRRIAADVEAAAANDLPVLIEGESGTGRRLAAGLIIKGGRRARGPMITINCLEPGINSALEIFGQDVTTPNSLEQRQIGALELCAEGTVVISDAGKLPAVVVNRLRETMITGRFTRLGGKESLPLKARIIVTRLFDSTHPQVLEDAQFDALFTGGRLLIPPLSKRRKDIPEIGEALLKKHCAALDRPVPELTLAARERLISYDWPGNVTELESVIRRAATLASDNKIEGEHILIHLASSTLEGRLDLFGIPWLRSIACSRAYPAILQIPTALGLGLLILLCFFGPQAEDNPALILTWPIWWAALPLTFLFFGRIWCTTCPFPLVSTLVQKVKSLNLKTPEFLIRTEIWPMTALFIFLTWADEYWHYPDFPTYTGVVLVCILSGAILCAFLFEGRVWCRYLCPLGGVSGVYSTGSIVELRSNQAVCAGQCRHHECVAKDSDLACPLFERPIVLDSNRNCCLCMNCVKACRNDAFHLFLRAPASEVIDAKKPVFAAGFLCALLVGTMALHGVCMYLEKTGLDLCKIAPATWFGMTTEKYVWTLDFFLAIAMAAGLMSTVSFFSSELEGKPFRDNLAAYGLPLAFMALMMHIALEGAKFCGEGIPKGFGMVASYLRLAVKPEALALFTPLFIRLAQIGFSAAALGYTVYLLVRVAQKRNEGGSILAVIPHLFFVLSIGLFFLGLVLLAPL